MLHARVIEAPERDFDTEQVDEEPSAIEGLCAVQRVQGDGLGARIKAAEKFEATTPPS